MLVAIFVLLGMIVLAGGCLVWVLVVAHSSPGTQDKIASKNEIKTVN